MVLSAKAFTAQVLGCNKVVTDQAKVGAFALVTKVLLQELHGALIIYWNVKKQQYYTHLYVGT